MPYPRPDLPLSVTTRTMREERGVTREALAHEAGVTVGALARVELGFSAPSWDTVRRVAAALGLSVSDFITIVEDRREGLVQR
jgi:transcriptional regulator with XRE-family HTH domain